ncbi:MAG: Rieske 2Fe-2S domain-containing protein [Candidatus Limnocylindrales bacterium]
MARLLARLISANDRWAKPFGDFNHRWLAAVFRPIRPVKDLLNGTWLGHPLHPAVTDIPIGAFLAAVVLDLVALPTAAFWAVVVGQVAFVTSLLTGLADYADTDGSARARATIHGTIMVIGGALTAASLVLRQGGAADGAPQTALLILGLLVISAGAYVGGDVVYLFGNMVSRHAFRGAGTKWIRLDTGAIDDLTLLADSTPTKMKAGINDLVVVRIGDSIHVLHAQCAHAGGPLAEGRVTPDGCLECPWHGARYRLTDGALRRGPSVYDQPSYEIRPVDGGGYEVRRAVS